MLLNIIHILDHLCSCLPVVRCSEHMALKCYSLCHFTRRPQQGNINIKKLNSRMCTPMKLYERRLGEPSTKSEGIIWLYFYLVEFLAFYGVKLYLKWFLNLSHIPHGPRFLHDSCTPSAAKTTSVCSVEVGLVSWKKCQSLDLEYLV